MLELSPDEHNALEYERELARIRAIRDAFVALFGAPGEPTPHGDIVLAYLDRFCGRGKLQVALDKSDATDIPRTFLRIGRREVADAIHDMIAWREPHAHGS